MSLKSQISFWSPALGDILFGSAQAGAIGTSFGNGAATAGANAQNSLQMGTSGDINTQVSSAGVQPGATAADKVLAVYSLPAGAFDIAARGIDVQAQGSFAATANSKRIKIIFAPTAAVVGQTVTGGTTIADTGTVATNGGGWSIMASVFKYGAAGSNTQLCLHQQSQVGAAVSALLAPSLTTAPENAPILIAVTGNATTAVTDIVFNFLQITAMN